MAPEVGVSSTKPPPLSTETPLKITERPSHTDEVGKDGGGWFGCPSWTARFGGSASEERCTALWMTLWMQHLCDATAMAGEEKTTPTGIGNPGGWRWAVNELEAAHR
jgi:hypothetical protein